MTKLTVLSADDKRAEIRRLYFSTTRQTIDRDLAAAVKLLTSMDSEEERERARVFMEGLSQMRAEWGREERRRAGGGKGGTAAKAPHGKNRQDQMSTPTNTGASGSRSGGGKGRPVGERADRRGSRKPPSR